MHKRPFNLAILACFSSLALAAPVQAATLDDLQAEIAAQKARLEKLEAAPRHIGHQLVAVAEMAIGCRRADAGRTRRFGESEARGPLFGDERESGADQRLAEIAVVIAAPARALAVL